MNIDIVRNITNTIENTLYDLINIYLTMIYNLVRLVFNIVRNITNTIKNTSFDLLNCNLFVQCTYNILV